MMKKMLSFRVAVYTLLMGVWMQPSAYAAEHQAVEIFPADVKNWKQAGPGEFSIKDGVATSEGGMGLWWYAGSSYENATFDMEFSLPATSWNSGIFVRFPNPGKDPWIAVRQGYECQLSGDKADKLSTGAIYDIQRPSHISLKKPGEWNSYQITTWNDKIIIVINGELVNVYTAQKGRGDKAGHIGLQNHDPVSRVSYRKVTVTEWGKKLGLQEVLDKIGVTRADWVKYHNGNNEGAKWHEKMDIGPVWANVFKDHYNGEERIASNKCLALELSLESHILGLYDTETLRMSSASTAKLQITGTPWTGAHGGISRLENKQNSIMQTSMKAGWADRDGSFEDKRRFPGHGNLAKDHARYKGYYRHGAATILDSSVMGSQVLEAPSGRIVEGHPFMFRQFEMAPCVHDRVLLVSDALGADVQISADGKSGSIRDNTPVEEAPKVTTDKVSVVMDRSDTGWADLAMGAPSAGDLVDRSQSKEAYFRVIEKFLPTHSRGGDEEGVAVRLNDGLASRNDDDVERSYFFADAAKQGRLEMNLKKLTSISQIHLYSNHIGDRAPQNVEIYGALDDTADPEAEAEKLNPAGWEKIATYHTRSLGDGGKHGVAVIAPKSGKLGDYHKLLFLVKAGNKGSRMNTFFSEIDIYGENAPKLKKIAQRNLKKDTYITALKGDGLSLAEGEKGELTLKIPASDKNTILSLGYAITSSSEEEEMKKLLEAETPAPSELHSLTKGGITLYPETVTAEMKLGNEKDTWAVDTIGLPVENPWGAVIKPGGMDLFADGDSVAISTWNGDVWIGKGLKSEDNKITWRRFATGLYEPLGLAIIDGVIYVNERSQITRLHDRNGDGEADWYESFNNDVFVTSNFHEFTFGLERDEKGNLYIAKGSPVLPGGRGFDKILPHNGTLLKISPDGASIEVVATGLRAPGGMAIGPNGELTTGENEGSWQPCCKLNYVTERGKFLGVEDVAQGLKGEPMHLPLCYLPMRIDNSGGGQRWVPEGVDWGLESGELIHLSYGKSTLYRVLRQEVDGTMQGGVVKIPVKIDSSAMRARFHKDGSLYVTGFRGWQTNAASGQALHRIRYTGADLTLPDKLEATEKGIYLRFGKKLDPASVSDQFNFNLERWKYIRSAQYGSGEFSIDKPDKQAEALALKQEMHSHKKHDKITVSQSQLLPDGKTIFLRIPDMKPAEQMSIRYRLSFADGSQVSGEVVNTVHKLAKDLRKDIAELEQNKSIEIKDLKAGLLQTITLADKTDHRVARLPAQYTEAGDAVSDMLGLQQSAYTSKWSGYLELTERMSPVFSLQGNGKAELKINGVSILREEGSLGKNKSEKLRLNPGLHRFELSYTGADDGSGHIRVMWEEESFPIQSIKPAYFKYQPNEKLGKALQTRHGRDIFIEQKCASCHQPGEQHSLSELSYRGPDLRGIGSRVKKEWLTKWLTDPHKLKPSTTMPSLVDGSTEQGRKDAADMAEYLSTLKAENELTKIDIPQDDAKKGGAHFHNLGCVACHNTPDSAEITDRVPLNNVNEKYDITHLTQFLLKPDQYHTSTKMPDFRLGADEARQLASYLHTSSAGKTTKLSVFPKRGDAQRGQKLIKSGNCAACHSELPAAEKNLSDLSAISKKSWRNHGCASIAKAGHSEIFHLTEQERDALETFRTSLEKVDYGSLTHRSSYDFAQRQITALNCAACHERDGAPALLDSLHSHTQRLLEGVPQDAHHQIDQTRPSLSYTGEMLHSDYLEKMLDGKVETRPRPWLAMRMPAFHSRSKMLAKGISAQHGMPPSRVDTVKLDTEKIKIGKKIIGAQGGFACTICHANGDSKALAAFEVEGINFSLVAERLRPGYYHQWMENPTSITPTTKMPRYTTDNKSPLKDYDGDAEKQFEAVLEYLKSLNDQ